MNKALLKRILFTFIKYTGGFHLSRYLTRNRLRILCYHGISLAEENKFRPGVYMHPDTFRRRMEILRNGSYTVLALDDALKNLYADTMPNCSTVITIDDGWTGTASIAAPILNKLSFPSTLYVTSYYLKNRTQVFNIALAYILMIASKLHLKIEDLAEGLHGTFDLGNAEERENCFTHIITYGKTLNGAECRQQLLDSIANRLEVSEALNVPGLFRIMSHEDIASVLASGMDIQLHTHRHNFPCNDKCAAEREIIDNREELMKTVSGTLLHFCYPSGEYTPNHAKWLKEWGIESATTCDVGLNTAETNPYFLKRILDTDILSDIEFEAELSGFIELKRMATQVLGRSR